MNNDSAFVFFSAKKIILFNDITKKTIKINIVYFGILPALRCRYAKLN